MTQASYRVTRIHIDHSYWQAPIYIHHSHEAGHIWVPNTGNTKLMSETFNLTITMSIHFI